MFEFFSGFGMINSVMVEFAVWLVTFSSINFVLMGLIWPLVERWMEAGEAEELVEACREIDAQLLEKIGKEIDILARQERALLWHINPGRTSDWISMAWSGLEPIVRRREMLEEQITYIWMTPIILT